MKTKLFILSYIVLMYSVILHGQTTVSQTYQRELYGVSDSWHRITLPESIFEKTNADLSDLRIFGVDGNKDTLETPYLLKKNLSKIVNKKIKTQLLNSVYNEQGYYYTLEVPTTTPVNQLVLDFDNKNFDWQVSLEASQNQQEWFTLVASSRVLSIKNEQTDYAYTQINFPNSNYRFYRLMVKSKENPNLTTANINLKEQVEGKYRTYKTNKITKDKKKLQLTEHLIDLPYAVPVSRIQLAVESEFDYYRSVSIDYVSDSILTEKGWIYNYKHLLNGTLNSIEDNNFMCTPKILKKMRIRIFNKNNQVLKIPTITVKGPVYELITRISDPEAEFFLSYGNLQNPTPIYDIERFESHIPKHLTSLKLGKEKILKVTLPAQQKPLFENKMWLWAIMGIILILMGWFSIKMLKS